MPTTMARTEWSGRCANSPGPGQHPVEVLTMSERTCSIDACQDRSRTRGWCSRHYQRWLKYGDPEAPRKNAPQSSTCIIDGYGRASYLRGWCSPHYQRWSRHGDPLGGRPVRRRLTPDEAFAAFVVVAVDGCWIWAGDRDSHGYGRVHLDGESHYAHRWVYEREIGAIPAGLVLDHLCHTLDRLCAGSACRHRLCVNPTHLEPVTLGENSRRGGQRWAIGGVLAS